MRTAPAGRWWAPGDWNAFCGLALDNLGLFVIFSGLLIGVFRFPSDLVLHVMVPGTAVGVLLGNLAYTVLAVRLMRRTGRSDDRTLNVERLRLACGLRAPPRIWTFLSARLLGAT